jgi:hypothetical protein
MAGLFSAKANAETAHGKFKLPTETRWGKLLLAPGEYEFTISTDAPSKIVIIHSERSGWSGMIMPEATSVPVSAGGASLQLGKSESGTYIRSLALGDIGMTLNFRAPKPGKVTRLMQPQPSQVAFASGSH